MTTDEPTFVVEREELGPGYAVDEVNVLVPQFWPSELSEDDGEFYDLLQENEETFDGAIDASSVAPNAQPGDEVSLAECRERIEAAMEQIRRAYQKMIGGFSDLR